MLAGALNERAATVKHRPALRSTEREGERKTPPRKGARALQRRPSGTTWFPARKVVHFLHARRDRRRDRRRRRRRRQQDALPDSGQWKAPLVRCLPLPFTSPRRCRISRLALSLSFCYESAASGARRTANNKAVLLFITGRLTGGRECPRRADRRAGGRPDRSIDPTRDVVISPGLSERAYAYTYARMHERVEKWQRVERVRKA